MKNKTTATLLAVVAVLLAANLIVEMNGQEAQAQLIGPPRVVGMTTFNVPSESTWRIWSDGVVEYRPFGNDAEGNPCWIPGLDWHEVVTCP